MKKLILGVILIILTTLIGYKADAHYITPVAYCSAINKVTVEMADWTVGSKNLVAYIYTTKNGTQDITSKNPVTWFVNINLSKTTTFQLNDSIGAISQSEFTINVPSWITNLYGTENDNYPGNHTWLSYQYSYKDLPDECLALPITLTSFTGLYEPSNRIKFNWTVTMEQNVDHYEVWQLMPDNNERKVSSQVSLGDTQIERSYSTTVNYSNENIDGNLQSGLFILFGFGLIISIALKRKMIVPIIGIFIVSLGFTSCSKSEVNPTISNAKSGIFRLKEIDRDGTTKTFQYINVYINN